VARLRFWFDAQLPPQLAPWLAQMFSVQACGLDQLGLRHSDDASIFNALRRPGEVIVSKDPDFVDLIARLSAPPQLLWVTCGNVTNRGLRELLLRGFPEILRLLQAGDPIVELSRA
jgi:predicted nuclease of predicted toxin-antitoxin system